MKFYRIRQRPKKGSTSLALTVSQLAHLLTVVVDDLPKVACSKDTYPLHIPRILPYSRRQGRSLVLCWLPHEIPPVWGSHATAKRETVQLWHLPAETFEVHRRWRPVTSNLDLFVRSFRRRLNVRQLLLRQIFLIRAVRDIRWSHPNRPDQRILAGHEASLLCGSFGYWARAGMLGGLERNGRRLSSLCRAVQGILYLSLNRDHNFALPSFSKASIWVSLSSLNILFEFN